MLIFLKEWFFLVFGIFDYLTFLMLKFDISKQKTILYWCCLFANGCIQNCIRKFWRLFRQKGFIL